MAIGISGASAFNNTQLQAAVTNQLRAQSVFKAIQTGGPLPASVRSQQPHSSNSGGFTRYGGFSQSKQATSLYNAVQNQRQAQAHLNSSAGVQGPSYSTGYQQMNATRSLLSQMMTAMSQLGGGFSSFIGGPSAGFAPTQNYGASNHRPAAIYAHPSTSPYNPTPVYTAAPSPPAHKGGYA